MTIESLTQQAFGAFQAGEWHRAWAACLRLLIQDPSHLVAHRLMAIMATQSGNLGLGASRMGRALALNPQDASSHQDLANMLVGLGQPDEALKHYGLAIELDPMAYLAFHNRGNLLQDQGHLHAAISDWEAAIARNPLSPQSYLQRGIALRTLGRLTEAVKNHQRALILFPSDRDQFNALGQVLQALQNIRLAERHFQRALRVDPGFSAGYLNLSHLLQGEGDPQALRVALAAIALTPEDARGYVNRGIALQKAGDYLAATASHQFALRLAPSLPEAHLNLGSALQKLEQYDRALESYDRTLMLQPAWREALMNRGVSLQSLGLFEEALVWLERAVRRSPDHPEVYLNWGNGLREMTRFDEALEAYDQAIALKPDFPDAQWSRSTLLLLTGKYSEGFRAYESRFEMTDYPARQVMEGVPELTLLRPEGSVLVYAEQGFGDVIQFARYVPLLADQGLDVVFVVQVELKRLLATLDQRVQVIASEDGIPLTDWICPLLNLPALFKTEVETVPWAGPYLGSLNLGGPLGQGQPPHLRVGMVWAGNPDHRNDRNRSIPLEAFSRLFLPNLKCVALQKGLRPEDRQFLHEFLDLHVIEDHVEDFLDTAEHMMALDLVITVDTSLAHLAGAMGIETWLLLPYMPDYRWMMGRSDTPWYPSCRIYRQNSDRTWDRVISDVIHDLKCRKAALEGERVVIPPQ